MRRIGLGALLFALALAATLDVRAAGAGLDAAAAGVQAGPTAPPPRSARDGVYTAAQAARGEALYAAACAICHAPTLAGGSGPSLAGPAFLAAWGGRPLTDLFDKVHRTMPATAPGSLSAAQVADLVAFMLQRNRFAPGGAELVAGGAPVAAIMLPAPPAAAAAAASTPAFPATGNLNQVMRGILFPSSNVLFDVQTQDPGAKKSGAHAEAGTTSARYGDVYDAWAIVDAAAVSLAEVGPLLMTPGRRCENGKPVPVDQANWQQWVRELVEVGRATYRTAQQTRSQEAVSEMTNKVADACANCHRAYRDVASAAQRCTP